MQTASQAGTGRGDEQGLVAEDFRMINRSGFGDGLNSYTHSMAWFQGRLFVGTTRGVLQMNKCNEPMPNMKPWPTDWKADVYDYDRRAEIWRYDPADGLWIHQRGGAAAEEDRFRAAIRRDQPLPKVSHTFRPWTKLRRFAQSFFT